MRDQPKTRPKCRAIVSWLLFRWNILFYHSAIEKLQIKSMPSDIKEAWPNLIIIDFGNNKPSLQIEIVKNKIVNLIPEAVFILPGFEDDTDLSPEDFIEMYIDHQKLSIQKVRELMKKLGIK